MDRQQKQMHKNRKGTCWTRVPNCHGDLAHRGQRGQVPKERGWEGGLLEDTQQSESVRKPSHASRPPSEGLPCLSGRRTSSPILDPLFWLKI